MLVFRSSNMFLFPAQIETRSRNWSGWVLFLLTWQQSMWHQW